MNRSNSNSLLREHFIYIISYLHDLNRRYMYKAMKMWIVKMGRNMLETCWRITRNVLLHFPRRANNSIRSQENWIRALYLWQGQSQSTSSAAFATFPWSFRGRIRGIARIEPLIKARDCRTSIRTLIRGRRRWRTAWLSTWEGSPPLDRILNDALARTAHSCAG